MVVEPHLFHLHYINLKESWENPGNAPSKLKMQPNEHHRFCRKRHIDIIECYKDEMERHL